MRYRTIAIASIAVSLLATGCSGSKKHDDAQSNTVKSAGRSSAAKAAAPVQNPLPKSVPNTVSLRRNVSMSSCAASSDGWTASGTARNPSTKTATYKITVFFTTDKATVQDYGATSVSVEPGKTANWTASKSFKASKPTLCVLRGVA